MAAPRTRAAPAAADTPPGEAPRREHPVLSPVRHDGELFAPGEVVLLTDAEAEVLIALGVLAEPAPAQPAGSPVA